MPDMLPVHKARTRRSRQLLFIFGTIPCLDPYAQPLTTDEAYFFAEQLHDREVLSDHGYLVLQEEIREGRLAKRSQMLERKAGMAYGELRVSSLLGFISHVYRKEEHWRTAYPHVAKLAQTFFGDPPPVALSPEQSNKLLAEARKPLLYAGRSVTGNDYAYTATVLKELGLVSPADLAEIDLSDFPEALPLGQFYFNQLGRVLADRDQYPERAEGNRTFLDKAVALGFLDQTTAAKFKKDSSVIGGGSRLPFFQAFTERQATIKLARPMTYREGLPRLLDGIRSLSPHLKDAELTYKFTPNDTPPEGQYADGDDLTLTLTAGGNTYGNTTRRGRPYPGREEPVLMINQDLLGLFSRHFAAINQDLVLFSIRKFDQKEQTITLLLLSDAEARSLMEWTMFETVGGPRKYLRPPGF